MSPIRETGLVVERELRRNFRSAKGVALLVLSLLGGLGASLALVKLQQLKRAEMADVTAEQMRQLREVAILKMTGDDAFAKSLADAPEVLLAMMQITVWLTPGLIALMGFDAISSELQHRSLRYFTARTRRASYFAGKALGLFLTVSLITLVLHAIVWGVCIARGEAPSDVTMLWGPKLWLTTLPISLCWCALAAAVSATSRVPILALLATFVVFFVVWLVQVIASVAGWEAVTWIYPNRYDLLLLSPRPDKLGLGFLACAAFTFVTGAAGTVLFAKRDV